MPSDPDPCTVCRGTDLQLIDGFYYCTECGTQNTNVRETVVEQKALGDGTFAQTTRRKIVKVHDSKIQMSGEWYKWHAYNFILSGLADELVELGAKPSFKIKLLWIWTRYITKYQNKSELGLSKKTQDEHNITLTSFLVEENSNSHSESEDNDNELETEEGNKKIKKNMIMAGSRRDIRFLSRGVILSMLYLALNLDKSDIQLSHIYRFIKEKRLNLNNLQRFVPEDINVKSIELWVNFLRSKLCNMHQVRSLSMSLLRKLDLGTPIVPDLRKIVDNIFTELCLPNDLKPLTFSLMHFIPCDSLDINDRSKEDLVRLPDYEGVVMSYVLVAMKMCFGLDNHYEVKLSNVVENINQERDLPKSHRIGKYSEPSNRLFSFREWCSYLHCRKIILCKSCLHVAEQHYLDIDDYMYLEHMDEMPVGQKDLQDETAFNLINKIPEDNEQGIIPKELFVPTLTPLSEYTDIVIEHSQDQEKRLLLSEDFTQYSLKYACEYLQLVDLNADNIVNGVSDIGKTIKKVILGTIAPKKSKTQMVYVKNCENRNWMITNPPTMEHVTCVDPQNESNDKESDHGYDSENPTCEKDDGEINVGVKETIPEEKQVLITEDDEKNIFDDLFIELDIKDEMEQNNLIEIDGNQEEMHLDNNNIFNDDLDNISDTSDTCYSTAPFDPDTFDREKVIKELILGACKKYKIPIPTEYKTTEPRKRKIDIFGNEEAGSSMPRKRSKTKRGERKMKIEEILNSYYSNMQSDVINQMQQELSKAIRNTSFGDVLNLPQNITQNETILGQNNDALSDAAERSSICTENTDNQSNVNVQNSATEPNTNKDVTNVTVDDIDENLEPTLFDDDEEIKSEDLVQKGDPKFDEKIYDVKQLYIKIKPEEEEYFFDTQTDPKLEEIIDKKIEECKNSAELDKSRTEPIVKPVKTRYQSVSEDEIPLNVLQQDKNMIDEMMAQEENYDPLINNENIPEFKYWFRHYDPDFMLRSIDSHKKFDEELKENIPTSFYFVLQECAAILNYSTFFLYKNMQNLEQYLIIKAKKLD